MTKLPSVTILGAGIAGLTAALALLRRGFDVTVLEQAGQLGEIGAGIQIGPNGSRVLLDLGLGEALAPIVCEATAKEIRLWNTGETWKLFDLGQDCIDRFGAPYWMVHRADFHRVLLAAVLEINPAAIRTGFRGDSFTMSTSGCTIHAANGRESVNSDVLIAADGVHSALRAALGAKDRPSFTGIMAWRGLVPAERLPVEMRRPVGVNWVGPGGHVITYPLRGGELYNFVAVVEGRDWPIESWTEAGEVEECLADFPGWHPEVLHMIRSLEQPFKWAFLERPPLERWAYGRVCLIGDACHATLPFLAQGANMAIEDGLLLARCLEAGRDDPVAALQRLERLRAERTARIVHASNAAARRFHNPVLRDPVAARDYVTAEWQPDLVRTRYDWLYEYDARAIDVMPPTEEVTPRG
jgi:salicylate hydroxylase